MKCIAGDLNRRPVLAEQTRYNPSSCQLHPFNLCPAKLRHAGHKKCNKPCKSEMPCWDGAVTRDHHGNPTQKHLKRNMLMLHRSRSPCEVDGPKRLSVALGRRCLAGDEQSHSLTIKIHRSRCTKEVKSGKHVSTCLPFRTCAECNMHECSPEHAGLSFGCVCVRTQGTFQNIRSCHRGTNQRVPHTVTLKLIQTAPPEISLLTCLAYAASGSCRSGSRTVCRPFCHLDSWPISSQSQSQTRRGTP